MISSIKIDPINKIISNIIFNYIYIKIIEYYNFTTIISSTDTLKLIVIFNININK